MSSPKEKAQELFEKMYSAKDIYGNYPMCHDMAQQCAWIAVDEIAEAIDWHELDKPNKEWDYWAEVKQEIERL